MFSREKLNDLNAFFKTCQERGGKVYYFCRLDSYCPEVKEFLIRYMEEVTKHGVYLKGKLLNPDEKQLSFLSDIVGTAFLPDGNFIFQTLKKWLPRLNPSQLETVTESMFLILTEMTRAGKTENMLKNAYYKFMCWLYYKFERILTQIGQDKLPKIIYEGSISDYELKMLRILALSGCDVILLETKGELEYLKLDPDSKYSQIVSIPGASSFPPSFSLAGLAAEAARASMEKKRSSGEKLVLGAAPSARPTSGNPAGIIQTGRPASAVADKSTGAGFKITTNGVMGTNIWLSGDVLKDILKPSPERGSDSHVYYNLFVRMKGTDDREEYQKELLRFKLKLENQRRILELIEWQIGMPDPGEIQQVRRGNYNSLHQLLADMLVNINYPKCRELENLAKKAFVDLLGESKKPLQSLTNQAVLLLCWMNRFIPKLFREWKIDTNPVFIYFGSVKNENEALFLRLLSRLPVDVLILCPDLETAEMVKDPVLFEKKGAVSAQMKHFPQNIGEVSFGTVAYQAEQELNDVLYQDTGVYRNRQFKRAIPVPIRVTYEEIGILWNQEAKYRPDFEVLDDRVMVPAIFAKVSGVKDGDRSSYWQWVKGLITEDTFLIKSVPYLDGQASNPVRQHVTGFLKYGKLQVEKIRKHPSYQYGFLREDMQDYMFDKLEQLLESRIIEGTYTQGTEFTICSVALNLDKDILRMVQRYDFTKKIPKLILINTAENLCSLEDSILTAYLSMLGFDVLLLIPTGYQSVERFYSRPLFVEHQIGEYIYDMPVPNLKRYAGASQKDSFIDKLFRRGR